MRTKLQVPVMLSAAAAVLAGAGLATAGDPFLEQLSPDDLARSPSARYARMTRAQAVTELRTRSVSFEEVGGEAAPTVVAPVRLLGRLNGVRVHGMVSGPSAARSPFEVLDARLALTLHDFTSILARHDVDQIVHFSMYRPARPAASASASAPAGAPSAVLPASRHPAGLAIDVATLIKRDGTELQVGRHFAGAIGQRTCGGDAPAGASPEARELRAIVCEAAAARVFTYVLTPNYNRPHHDHFHMEIKPGVSWMLIH